jgi:hypothetical protein
MIRTRSDGHEVQHAKHRNIPSECVGAPEPFGRQVGKENRRRHLGSISGRSIFTVGRGCSETESRSRSLERARARRDITVPIGHFSIWAIS